jgi:glycosyltransferase involved in cell wall biosynthesis
MKNIDQSYTFDFSFTEIFIYLTTIVLSVYMLRILNLLNSYNIFNNLKNRNFSNTDLINKKKIGLLTNEIPPIVYGGVATWIINFMDMFKNDEDYEVIPIYLAYQDYPPEEFKKYENIRIIYNQNDISKCFEDIDICINNIWISLDTIKKIKNFYPTIPMVSVCHSLIQMEHKTNLGSQYQVTWEDQEITFKNSDYVVLISDSEKEYYFDFKYNEFKAKPFVIYNSYQPKYDNKKCDINYNLNNPGYIGRHVPRKRPELPLFAVKNIGEENIEVYNMGVDYKNGSNLYWERLNKKNKQLTIIPFSSDPVLKKKYWENIGVNCITGIYEPFGYTMCETLDRRVPCIVQDIGGPSEIIKNYEKNVITYKVDMDFNNDVENFSTALKKFWELKPDERKLMAENARKALDRFRPEVIKEEWKCLLNDCNESLYNEYGNMISKLESIFD